MRLKTTRFLHGEAKPIAVNNTVCRLQDAAQSAHAKYFEARTHHISFEVNRREYISYASSIVRFGTNNAL
jgi:hypothetical protein